MLRLLLADRHDRRIHSFDGLQELAELVEAFIIDQLVKKHGAVDREDFIAVGLEGEGGGGGDGKRVEVEAKA